MIDRTGSLRNKLLEDFMKKIIAIVLSLCLLSSGVVASAAPLDVNGTQFQSQMEKLLSMLDIMNGYPDGNFYPENYVTRAEFAKIAVAASSYRNSVAQTSLTSPFQDVPYTYWGASYIKVASANNLIKGYPDSTFRPEENVLLEEAVTVALKLLGYTDEDFGLAWPDGQMNEAAKLDLLEGIDKSVGDALQRGDVMTLIYNTLNTNVKGGQTKYIESFGYKIVEDAVLIATTYEDPSVSKDKIVTSSGTYNIGNDFDYSMVGLKGDVVLKNGDELVAVFPVESQAVSYGVYSTLNNDIIAYVDNTTKLLELDENTTAYFKSQTGTLESFIPSIKQGYVVTVYSNYMGDTDYIVISDQKMAGPLVVEDSSWMDGTGLDQASVNVLRDGKPASLSDIDVYDVIYYSQSLNTIWAYSKKVTGVYDKALPSKEQVTSVTISGVSYELETIEAFNQLGPAGEFNINDTVTLLLGRDGKVVKVLGEGVVKTDQYIVYSKLASDVIVYSDGKLTQLDMDKNTTAYFNGQKSTLGSVISSMEVGHILSVVYNADNSVDYVTVNSKKIDGPYTVTSSSWMSDYGIKSDATYLRDGESSSQSDIAQYDILYYSSEMNVVWAYSKKITGTYEKATPNKDSLTSITVSGTSYEVESVSAFDKLSSGGQFSLGDTVTLLIGKDGGVADVISPGDATYVTYGYLIDTGTKEFENASGDTFTANYARVATASGDEFEYRTNKDYKDYLSKVVSVRLTDGIATLTHERSKDDLRGEFDAQALQIGTTELSSDVKILDVMNSDISYSSLYTTVFKQRLDGVNFTSGSVLFYTTDSSGKVDQLFLNDLTGDGYKYGIVTSANSGGESLRGTYVCDIDGAEQTLSTSGVTYSIKSGDIARFSMVDGRIERLQKIEELDSKVVKVDDTYVYTADNQKYQYSDKVVVYQLDANWKRKIIPLSEIKGRDDLSLTAYYDRLPEAGGRIRVLFAGQNL